jgi:hypothetical protein
MKFIPIILLILSVSQIATAQKKPKKCNEGCEPKVTIYEVSNDSIKILSYLSWDKDTRIRVVLEGGIENVRHTMFVTSKHAIIQKDTTTKNEYLIHPLGEVCEIIVDVKTYELYKSFREIEQDGKVVRQFIKDFPPKTYMVAYQRYEVR